MNSFSRTNLISTMLMMESAFHYNYYLLVDTVV